MAKLIQLSFLFGDRKCRSLKAISNLFLHLHSQKRKPTILLILNMIYPIRLVNILKSCMNVIFIVENANYGIDEISSNLYNPGKCRCWNANGGIAPNENYRTKRDIVLCI